MRTLLRISLALALTAAFFVAAARAADALVATVTLDNTVAYPGTAVLLPTLGTAALIAAGCGPGFAPLHRWLASGGMVAIGQLSYSWYLWHWPLLSLARTNDLGERYLARDGTIALVSLGLAWLTYRFIEHPIRSQQYRGFRSTRATLLSGAAMSAVVLCCALGLGLIAQYFYAHPLDRQQKLTADAVYDRPASTAACLEKQHSTFAALARDRRCFTQPSQPVELVLWGDSHANHWFPLMRQASHELHMNVEEFARASCPPLLGVMPAVMHPDVIVTLGPGDALVCFTDGVTEGRGPDGMFGEERLAELLRGLAGLSASELVDRIVDAAIDFQGGRSQDDVAVLALRVPSEARRA